MSNLKIKNIKERMNILGLDSVLIASNENKYYLVGFEDEARYTDVDAFLFLTKDKDYLIVECCDEGRAKVIAPQCVVLAVADREPLGVTLKKIVDETGNIRSIGYEGLILKHFLYNGKIGRAHV